MVRARPSPWGEAGRGEGGPPRAFRVYACAAGFANLDSSRRRSLVRRPTKAGYSAQVREDEGWGWALDSDSFYSRDVPLLTKQPHPPSLYLQLPFLYSAPVCSQSFIQSTHQYLFSNESLGPSPVKPWPTPLHWNRSLSEHPVKSRSPNSLFDAADHCSFLKHGVHLPWRTFSPLASALWPLCRFLPLFL